MPGTEDHFVLKFPTFHTKLRSQKGWTPSEKLGRIRVEFASGCFDVNANRWTTLVHMGTFSFMHVPRGMSSSCLQVLICALDRNH